MPEPQKTPPAAGAQQVPLELLEKLSALHPDDPAIQRKCGEMYFAARCMPQALESFQRVLQLLPHDAIAHYAIGCTWQALGKAKEAEQSYREALAVQPALAGAMFNLGLLLRQELGRPDEAIPYLLAFLEINPQQHVEAHRSLGSAYFITEQMDAAIASYRRYVEVRPDAAIGHYELGCALSHAKFHEEAIPCFQKAIQLDPHFADAYHKLGNAVFCTTGFADAYPYYRRSYELRPLIKRPAARGPAKFSVLVLFAPGAANTPLDYLVGHSDYDIYILQVLPGVNYNAGLLNGSSDIALNLISDVDQGRDALAIAASIIGTLTMPVINPPEKILLTDRQSTARQLAGIPFCFVPAARRYRGSALLKPDHTMPALPYLVREAGTHNGDSFEKVDTASELLHCISQPDAEYYAIQYIDYQSQDGHFRKYRFMFISNEIYPYHLAIGDEWKVHHGTTNMADHPWMQVEEEAFLAHPEWTFKPQHYGVLRTIRDRVNLDFFGIDCGLDREGNVVVFEVNATMLIHQHNAEFPYKTPYVERIKQAFDAMLRTKAKI